MHEMLIVVKKKVMTIITEKATLFFILFLFTNTCNSQTLSNDDWRKMQVYYELHNYAMSRYEHKNISKILSIASESYFIDPISQDSSILSKQVEYYDGEGNLEFLYLNEIQDNDIRYWMKQFDKPHQTFNIYADGVKDSHFSIKSINDSTCMFELFQDDLNRSITVFIDSTMIRTLSDSTISVCKFDNNNNFTEVKNIDKNGKTSFILNLEILTSDKNNNWTSRIIKNTSNGEASTFFQKRNIKYADEYEISKYFELKIDSLLIGDQLIIDPEVLNPNNDGSKFNTADEDAKLKHEHVYESVLNLFHKKYFNKNYFLKFSASEKEETEILKDRLFKYLKTYVMDIKNKRYYRGRTNSKRWFDKTASFNRLEQMESQPSPTDNWIHINGYDCREYIKLNSKGKKEIFFVTEDLPFINYCDFTFTLPGFVMKSTRQLQDFGDITIVTSIKQSNYPFHFLAFLNELNDKYGVEIKYLQKIGK